MSEPPVAGSPPGGDRKSMSSADADGASTAATDLDTLLDGVGGDFRSADGAGRWNDALSRIAAADELTPEPDSEFVQSLRAKLFEPEPQLTSPIRSSHRLGIVATASPGRASLPLSWRPTPARRRFVTAVAAIAAMLLALVQFEPSWLDGNGNSFGVPTALASTTAVGITLTPTPTGVATVAHSSDTSGR